MRNVIVTEIDEFFKIVSDKEGITIEEICEIMTVEVETVERWAKALSEVGMVTLHYPIIHYDTGKIKLKANKHHHTKKLAYPTMGVLPSI